MAIHQDYDDLFEKTDTICPKCGSNNVTQASYDDEIYLCSECGNIFGALFNMDEEENDSD